MKTLKDIRELYEPKSADEKRFVDKHVIKKTADANGNGDEVFKASKVKTVKRSPEHGYDKDQDEKVYEEVEKSAKRAMKNEETEVDEGFASHAQRKAVWATYKDGGKGHPDNKKKKKMKEDVELDEVLKPSMGVKAYIDDFVKSDDPRFKGASKKDRIKRAIAAYYSAKRMQKEEVDLLVGED